MTILYIQTSRENKSAFKLCAAGKIAFRSENSSVVPLIPTSCFELSSQLFTAEVWFWFQHLNVAEVVF